MRSRGLQFKASLGKKLASPLPPSQAIKAGHGGKSYNPSYIRNINRRIIA
jgi:hypothetical protein